MIAKEEIHRRGAESAEGEADGRFEAHDALDDPVTRAVIGAAITVHRALGPGLLESAYQACLAHELTKLGIRFEREAPLPVIYDSIKLDCGYRMDFVIANQVVVEIKCVEKVSDLHLAQLITYLRLSGKERGLLLNFNVSLLKNGIFRRVLSKSSLPSASSAPLR